MTEEINGIKVVADSGFVTLTDRWGEEIVDRKSYEDSDEDAIARLVDSMGDETTFVVRRKSDGAYGLLLEPFERPHDGSMDEDKDIECPAKDVVLAELAEQAFKANAAYPGLDAWVESGPDVFLERASIRAFVPEGSPLLDQARGIAEEILSGTFTEAAPSP